MIDIHVHILPGLDDGAADVQTAENMAIIAVENGIHHIIATPHVSGGFPEYKCHDITDAVDKLNLHLAGREIALKIYPGAEYYLEPDLPDRFAAGELQTLNNSQYLLVELPADQVPPYTGQILYELQLQGAVPIIAHPERNHGFISNPQLLGEFIQRGNLTQITTGSITGMFGQKAEKAAHYFIRQNWGHVIASDAHSNRRRIPELSSADKIIRKIAGEQLSRSLLVSNPSSILAGKSLLPLPAPQQVRSFFSFWRHN